MIRWRWIAAVAVGVLVGIYAGAWLEARENGLHLTGTLGGRDTEGGYFELVTPAGHTEHDLVIAVKTDRALYPQLKALVGYHVQVSVFRYDE